MPGPPGQSKVGSLPESPADESSQQPVGQTGLPSSPRIDLVEQAAVVDVLRPRCVPNGHPGSSAAPTQRGKARRSTCAGLPTSAANRER